MLIKTVHHSLINMMRMFSITGDKRILESQSLFSSQGEPNDHDSQVIYYNIMKQAIV